MEKIIACVAICALLSGCGAQTGDINVQENTSTDENVNVVEMENVDETTENGVTVTTISEVFGDGQKPSAVAIAYPGEIVSVDDFEIKGQ